MRRVIASSLGPVADQLRPKVSRLPAFMDEAEVDVPVTSTSRMTPTLSSTAACCL
jgi:hypothetical protein